MGVYYKKYGTYKCKMIPIYSTSINKSSIEKIDLFCSINKHTLCKYPSVMFSNCSANCCDGPRSAMFFLIVTDSNVTAASTCWRSRSLKEKNIRNKCISLPYDMSFLGAYPGNNEFGRAIVACKWSSATMQIFSVENLVTKS